MSALITISTSEYQSLKTEISRLRQGAHHLQVTFQEVAGLLRRIEPNNENNRHCLEMIWGWLALADQTEPSTANPDNLPHAIAEACHEVNRAYCQSIGDHSQLPWKQAEQWQKNSAIQGVQFLLDHPAAGPGATHASWLATKEADGWRYGEEKDPANKTHPCMVPFEQLPLEQQVKDHLFVAVVRTLVNQAWPHALERMKPQAEEQAA